MVVRTTIVEPELKVASCLQQSPAMMNSASVQPEPRLSVLPTFVTVAVGVVLLTNIATASLPAVFALAVRRRFARFVIGCLATAAPIGELRKQEMSLGPGYVNVFQPDGQVLLYWISQYWMKICAALLE